MLVNSRLYNIDYSDSWGSSTVISCNKQVSADRIPFEASITPFGEHWATIASCMTSH